MGAMRTLRVLAALLLLVASASPAAPPALPAADWMLDQVRMLAGPETTGRESGTPGAERAARHDGPA